jgi:hypothetical protein
LFGPCAQINWRVISRKVLFDPHCFLTNKSSIHFAGESGKGNTFLNGKGHVQNKNRHRLPRSQTYAQQLKNLSLPYFSFPSTFKVLLNHSSKKKVIKKHNSRNQGFSNFFFACGWKDLDPEPDP